MVGPFVNSAGIVMGAVLGAVCGQSITPEFRTKINYVFGCIALGIGVFMTAKGNSLPPVILALLFGTMLGEAFRLEAGVMRLAFWSVGFLQRKKPAANSLPEQTFRDQFAVVTVIFCVSGLGVMGPMHEGMSGDPSLLCVKALLDFFTAMLFASNIGGVVGVLAVPQLLFQSVILLLATAVVPLTTPAMFGDFSACGGMIMMGAALRQCGLAPVPILGMLPGLFLVMPVSAIWARYFPF